MARARRDKAAVKVSVRESHSHHDWRKPLVNEQKKKIRIVPCGPFEVSGGVPLKQNTIGTNERGESTEWIEGARVETEEPYYLCRCGHSAHKPFCDGSHLQANFYGDETADKAPYEEQAARIAGPGIDLLDQKNLCAVARFCDAGKQVWGYVADSGDAACKEAAIRQACACPSGRLTAVTKEGERLEPELKQEIDLVEDPKRGCLGPLWVKGGIEITGETGAYEVRNRMTLCRCGESANMPFCDAAHLSCKHMKTQEGS